MSLFFYQGSISFVCNYFCRRLKYCQFIQLLFIGIVSKAFQPHSTSYTFNNENQHDQFQLFTFLYIIDRQILNFKVLILYFGFSVVSFRKCGYRWHLSVKYFLYALNQRAFFIIIIKKNCVKHFFIFVVPKLKIPHFAK